MILENRGKHGQEGEVIPGKGEGIAGEQNEFCLLSRRDGAFAGLFEVLHGGITGDCLQRVQYGNTLLLSQKPASSGASDRRTPDTLHHIRGKDRGVLMEGEGDAKPSCRTGGADELCPVRSQVVPVDISPVVDMGEKE